MQSVQSATATSCVLFLIIIGAKFSSFIVQTQLPQMLASSAHALQMPGLLVMALVVLA